jgi:dihydroorotate dehydrogenase (fumarate)
MIDISTKYLGLKLNSPVIAGSSDFTSTVSGIVEISNAGAGAAVLKSVFEEQILMEIDSQRTNNMFNNYTDSENYISFYTRKHALESYLDLIRDAKKEAGIPIIASVHCSTNESWVSFVREIEKAGASAIELNIFILPSNIDETDQDIANRYFQIVESVRSNTTLPIALKVHHYFTGMTNFLVRLSEKCQSLVLFNRFFNPDINIDTLTIESGGSFSMAEENGLIQRWTGILRPHVNCDLAATTGIHNGSTVIKNLLAGADVVQIATALYQNGPEVISSMNRFIKEWMDIHHYTKIQEFIGKLSYGVIPNPALYERAQFMKYFSGLGR